MRYGYTTQTDTATCHDCGKVFDCTANAQALAAQHARKYGHAVFGEKTVLYHYTGK